MCSGERYLSWILLVCAAMAACGGGSTAGGTDANVPPPSSATSGDVAPDDASERFDLGSGSGSPGGDGDGLPDDGPPMIDLLFVIDNSSSTAEEQTNLALNLPVLVAQLENLTNTAGDPVQADVQILVTTTDMEHSYCEGETSGQTLGRPVTTGCNDRIDDFEDVVGEEDFADVCRDICPEDVVPKDDSGIIRFGPDGDNLPDVDAIDVNGDGVLDSPAARSLACIGLQGIRGCGYEAPLDAMMAALDPDAKHNQGDNSFLRNTTEANCEPARDAVSAEISGCRAFACNTDNAVTNAQGSPWQERSST